jgi:2-(1,2-epoxy-1,2-dihydrophenyl)acetyl-CoA isomerase
MPTILTETTGAVTRITLNRPEKYNSMDWDTAKALQSALDDAEKDDNVRCIVITGAGKGFCAGQDLGQASNPDDIDFAKLVEEQYNAIIRRLRKIEKPIVAAVNGVAAGAGANIALACDIVVATESASFVQAFSKISLIPDSGGTFFLPRLVGLGRALALAMLAEKVGAEEAAQMGMIWRAYPDESFAEEVEKLASTLAALPTKALGLTKRGMNSAFEHSLEEQLAMEKELQVEAGKTEDFREGVQAFLEKRKPVFSGK